MRTTPHPALPSYVRLADIPQPWRDRFLWAHSGAQAPAVGGEGDVAHAAEWVLFLDRALRRLRAELIAVVLKDVQTGPSAEVLEAAPVLDSWFVVEDPAEDLCLHGAVAGHPRLHGQGRWIATSVLIGLDLEARTARTISRWYRLGKMVSPADCETLRGKPLNRAFRPANSDEIIPWLERVRALVADEGFDA